MARSAVRAHRRARTGDLLRLWRHDGIRPGTKATPCPKRSARAPRHRLSEVARYASDALVGARLFPEVQVALLGVLVDARELLRGELEVLERTHVVFDLLGRARADEGRRDARIAQDPRDGHLSERLPARFGDVVQPAHAR